MGLPLITALLPTAAVGLSALRLSEGDDLRFYKELENPYNSIFTSCTTEDDKLQCFQREVDGVDLVRWLDRATYSTNFELLSTERSFVAGEDPRVLNSSIVFDNFRHDMQMIDVPTKRAFPVMHAGGKAVGKNYIWFVHRSSLYAIAWLDPLTIYRCDKTPDMVNCSSYFESQEKQFGELWEQYRGGTVGYTDAQNNLVFGFGHQTYGTRELLRHEVFAWWLVGMDTGAPYVRTRMLELPGQMNICDPTSVVVVDQRLFLMTAESHMGWKPWWGWQQYHNKVYELRRVDRPAALQSALPEPSALAHLASVRARGGVWDLAQTNDDDPSAPANAGLLAALSQVRS